MTKRAARELSRPATVVCRVALILAALGAAGAIPAAADWNRGARPPSREVPAGEVDGVVESLASATDPLGDTFGVGAVEIDIASLAADTVGSDLVIDIHCAGPISSPDSGMPDAVNGFIDIDTDQTAATGDQPWTDFITGANATGMGNEFYVDLFSYSSVDGAADVVDDPSEVVVGRAPVTFTTDSMTVAIPLSLLGGDGGTNIAAVIGTFEESTDKVPNQGSVESQGPDTSILLNGGRFKVSVDWSTPTVPESPAFVSDLRTDDSGIFYFGNPDNLEFLIKVLDGCDPFDHYWVFFAATTDVEFTVTVLDTESDQDKEYTNDFGHPADAVTDTSAFATCP